MSSNDKKKAQEKRTIKYYMIQNNKMCVKKPIKLGWGVNFL